MNYLLELTKMYVLYFMVCLWMPTINAMAQGSDKDAGYTSILFIQNIIKGNYDNNLDQMGLKNGADRDSVTAIFDALRYRVMNEFGQGISFKYLGYNQALSLLGSNGYHVNTSKTIYVQIADHNRFSVFKLFFEQGQKIVFVDMFPEIYPKPDIKKLWLVGIPLMFFVLGFNIYVIIKIYRSNVTKKWLKYVMIIFLNIPVFGYNAFSGIFFQFFNLRILGIGFSVSNYFNTYWTIGVPLGAVIVLWRLKNNLYRTKEDDWIYEVAAEEQGT